MTRQTAARARAFVTFSVFALLTVAVVAAETGGDRSTADTRTADYQRRAPLILNLAGLAKHFDAAELLERAGS